MKNNFIRTPIANPVKAGDAKLQGLSRKICQPVAVKMS